MSWERFWKNFSFAFFSLLSLLSRPTKNIKKKLKWNEIVSMRQFKMLFSQMVNEWNEAEKKGQKSHFPQHDVINFLHSFHEQKLSRNGKGRKEKKKKKNHKNFSFSESFFIFNLFLSSFFFHCTFRRFLSLLAVCFWIESNVKVSLNLISFSWKCF